MFREIVISGHWHQLKMAVQTTLDESHEISVSMIDDEVKSGEVEIDESNNDDYASTAIDEETDPIEFAVCICISTTFVRKTSLLYFAVYRIQTLLMSNKKAQRK